MTKRVLLIDYESQAAERARGVLREREYEVVAAHDGEEALNAFSSSRFDLVLLSGMLPRLPSAEVIREIRRRGGATAPPILLMVSGYKGSNPKADAQRVGAFGLLPRPFSDEALRQAVTEALAATKVAAKTPSDRTPGERPPSSPLTSSDIFSDVLEDVRREAAPPRSPVRLSRATEEEVEKRLRDTLSGVLPKSAPPAKTETPRSTTDAEIERLLSETLPGLRRPVKPRSAPAPEPPARPLEPTAAAPVSADRFGQYEILERIASGGMAELFRARRSGVEGFQKIVAIKKILPHIAGDDEFITMFADEAKLAAQLNHPNIVHIFDLGKIDAGGYFIAMEHVEGRDLRSILNSARETGLPIPVPLAVSIAAKVAAALDYAHRRRGDEGADLHIVHRDVSPPNILVSSDGDIKLCDFGIAKAASKASRTESGALKGKVPYMSPEQAWGRVVDRRSDIYSLGSVLFEMLTGRKLFQGDSDMNVLEKVRAGDVVAPSSLNPEVPPPLDATVLKALARDPEDRYAGASDMLRDLEAALRDYEPAPSSADLASYVRQLEVEESARRETREREAQAPPPAPPASVPPRSKPKIRIPVPGATAPAPKSVKPAAPAPQTQPAGPVETKPPEPATPAVFAALFPEKAAEAEERKRVRLYAMIAAAAIVLAVMALWVTRKPSPARIPAAEATPRPAMPVQVANAITQPKTAPPAVVDQKAIQQETQQRAAKKKEMLNAKKEMEKARKDTQQAAELTAKPERPAADVKKPAPAPPTAAPPSLEPTPEVKVAKAQPARIEPTAVPPPPEPAPAVAQRAPTVNTETAAAVSRGDLVGPGEGVVEPTLVSAPGVAYPPVARQQRVTGRVVVLVLVNEEGTASEVKLLQGISAKVGVNEAVLDSIRHAKFRPATKNGVPVKMWRTVVVDVKP